MKLVADSPLSSLAGAPGISPAGQRKALRVSSAVLTLALAAGTFATGANRATAGPEKFLLAYKAQKGQTKRTKANATLAMEVGGEKLDIGFKSTSKVTFTEVGADGSITFEDKTESQEYFVQGEKADDEETSKPEGPDIVTVKPNGVLVAFKDGDPDAGEKDKDKLGVRLSVATNPIFPDKQVGVGDTWTHEYKANDTLGTRDAKADFEVLAFEKVGGVDCVKLKMSYAEAGSGAISGKGTVWVERNSGDKVSMDYAVEGVPFGEPGSGVTAAGDLHEERTEGGPLGGGAPVAPAADAKKADEPKKPEDPKKPGEKKDDAKTADATKPEEKKPEEKKPEPKKDKTIDEVVKDFEKVPGLLTLYRKKETGKDQIYAEVPEAEFGKMMMLQATASTGTAEQIVAGEPINDILFEFRQSNDDKLLMVAPNFWYRVENPELKRALQRSFADGYIQSFKIEAKQADRKSVLIDVSDLFRGDVAQISAMFQGGSPFPGMGSPGGGFGMDREKTFVETLKNFPENLVVTTQYHFLRGGSRNSSAALADPRSAPIKVTYNLSKLPTDNGYVPRIADPRIGYFLTEYMGFDDDAKEDPITRYIYRWDLRKKDPNAALSEPVKPIVFWVDNATPLQYREAVRDGILMWNKAFEKAGFKDAIVVKQMPDNPDPKDADTPTDTSDMRFNCIRWVVSPDGAYAVAQFRVNPITGQILNASITVDAGIIRSFKLERKSIVDPAAAFVAGSVPAGEGLAGKSLLEGSGPLAAKARARMMGGAAKIGDGRFLSHDPRYCQFGGEMFKQQAWLGFQALSLLTPSDMAALNGLGHDHATAAAGKRNPLVNEKEYAEQIVRETVGHEMGHILGLRHNFAASTQFTLEQLKEPALVKAQGIGASVMDYNPFNIAALKSPGVPFFSQTIGTYDYWAIEYGYTPAAKDVKKPEDELFALKQVAKKSGMPGHAYQSDELAIVGFDPKVMQYDLSADPLAYWQRTIQVSKQLLTNLDKRLPKNGESYYEFTEAYSQLLGLYAGAAGVASRYIGGTNVNRTHKGDSGEKPLMVPVDVAKQKQALGMLNQYIFAPSALTFPEGYYQKLANDPYGYSFPSDFPVREQLSGIQKNALARLFSGSVLTRVVNNEFKMGGDPNKALTLPYLFRSVSTNVWAELPTKGNVTTLRRQLQRAYVDRMIDMALKPGGGVPEDARMLAWTELRTLKGKLSNVKAVPTLDEYTRVHYTDTLAKVDRTLAAQVTIGGGAAPAAPSNLLQMLLGGKEGHAQEAAPAPADPSGN